MNDKEAIVIISELIEFYESENLKDAFRLAIKALKERPQGKWIDTGYMEEYWAEEYQCSICGAKDHWHKYCPNCGAYMGESEDNDYEEL